MADKDKSEYLEAWRGFKKDHPVLYSAAAVLPVTGQAAAVADYADAMDRGDSVDGAIAAASFIPGIGIAKAARAVKGIAPAKYELDAARAFAPNSARAKLAPLTERSKEIGLTADAEQVGETAAKEYQSRESSEKQDRAEFSRAFGERG